MAEELAERLGARFGEVEIYGVGASEPVRRYLAERSKRIQRIMRLDPLRLRDRLPRAWLEWLFANFAVLVRRRTRPPEGPAGVSWRDFPIGPADDACLDLLAICRRPH